MGCKSCGARYNPSQPLPARTIVGGRWRLPRPATPVKPPASNSGSAVIPTKPQGS